MKMQRGEGPGQTTPEHDGSEPRTQVAALCWRKGRDGFEVLVVTSRETGRWVLPKGWPVNGLSAAESARREAWEEAGVRGKVARTCLGFYSYVKVVDQTEGVPCVVAVYPMKVKAEARDWPERDERQRDWVTPAEAAQRVQEPELQRILADFDPAAAG